MLLLLFKYFLIQIYEMIHIFFWWHVTGSFMPFIKAILVGHVINQGRQIYNWSWRHACLTKESSLVYYKVRWTVITNCDSFLITKCDTVYYKLRQVLQSAMDLLQIATGITKCDDYYKLRQYPRSLLVTALQFSAFTWLDMRRINYDSDSNYSRFYWTKKQYNTRLYWRNKN